MYNAHSTFPASVPIMCVDYYQQKKQQKNFIELYIPMKHRNTVSGVCSALTCSIILCKVFTATKIKFYLEFVLYDLRSLYALHKC